MAPKRSRSNGATPQTRSRCPRLGDYILDAAANSWTILSVGELGARTRLRCFARNLFFVHALVDLVTIQQATLDGGGAIIGWTTFQTNVPAQI
jgi:hypothetical protein